MNAEQPHNLSISLARRRRDRLCLGFRFGFPANRRFNAVGGTPDASRAGMKRVLVGLDGSSRAVDVLRAAVEISSARGARILLLRSVGLPPEVPQDFWKTTDRPLLEVLEAHARKYLQEQASAVPPSVLDRLEVKIGVPWQVICETARAIDADLIVIGSHGYSGIDRLLGTTAAKVVNHASSSVLVVRGPHASIQ